MNKTQNNYDVAEFASELHWLAFCYVAGEMTAEQTVQFERRIAVDFEAQVAVADAVSLSSAIYVSVETLQDGKVSVVDHSQPVADPVADRSSSWRWMAATAAGFFVIVSAWQLLPNTSKNGSDNNEVAVGSIALEGQVANSASPLGEIDLWDRTVEIYRSANVYNNGVEAWADDGADELLDGDYYVNVDDDSEELADALLVDSDLASIFATAIPSFDLSKGEL